MIQACIFDMDGVIVDTAKYHFTAWQALAQRVGVSFTEKENENLKGIGRMQSLDYILNLGNVQLEEDQKAEMAAAKNEHYLSLIAGMNSDEILPGVLDFLNVLQARSIKIAVGSSSKNAPFILDRLDLRQYFDVVVDGNQTTRSKPDPQVFLMAAEAMDVEPNQSVVFEDAKAGVKAANAGGFYAVGVGDATELSEAQVTITSFQDFTLDILENYFNEGPHS